MRKPIIAIDGFSSTGKSSISKAIAEKLGFIHVDTGALYRGVTYFALQNLFNHNKIEIPQLIKNLDKINRGEKVHDFIYKDFGSLISLGSSETVGTLMGFLPVKP